MTVLLDVFHCADRCWLPKVMIIYNAMNGTARLLRVTGFEVGKRPSTTDFRLDFDTKVVIPDSAKGVVYDNLTKISLHDSQALKSHGKAARFIMPAAASNLEPAAMPEELGATFPYAFAAAVGLASAAVLVCAILIRNRWIRR
jgi:hypothetical protein